MANNSFCLLLGLLFGILYGLYAEGQGGIIVKYALIGQQVELTCQLNSTENVTWHYNAYGDHFPAVYTCQYNQNGQCSRTDEGSSLQVYTLFTFQARRSNDTSQFSLTLFNEVELTIKCRLGNVFMRAFRVKSIDPNKLESNCSVTSPSRNENGVGSMTLSCEVNSGELDVNLTLNGIGINILHDVTTPSKSVKAKTLNFDEFNNIHNASCSAYFPDIDVIRPCTYPNIMKAPYIVEGNDIIIECDDESDVDNWLLYGSNGREEDIKNRSWSRKGGRILLIKEISEKDVGKVVMCRTEGYNNQTNNGRIGLHVISDISGGDNTNSESPTHPPSAQNAYFVPTLLFLTLWLITTAVGGIWWGCTPKRNKSGTPAIASASGNASVPNGGSGERGTSLINVGTGARGDQNTLNTNNSAHNPPLEPEVNIADENNRNRQSNNESRVYFTLEKSSPSPTNSVPRAPTARWEQLDVNPALLNHPQSSYSQCYEAVGEPNKGATCSYDLGEYAEVSYQIQGKGPPDLGEYSEVGGLFQGKGPLDLSGRPSIRKKPGREKVKEDDISRLYSKVNK